VASDDVQIIEIEDADVPSVIYVPGGSGANLGPITARVDAAETELEAHHIRLGTLEVADDVQNDRILAIEAMSSVELAARLAAVEAKLEELARYAGYGLVPYGTAPYGA
jgi:hypothetical protein